MTSSSLPGPMLIQVLPRLMPGRCGVSDQAILLAGELKKSLGIDSAFVILNSTEQYQAPQAAIYCAPGELLENCLALSRGGPAALLVHVSGYGYSADGAPALLAEALEAAVAGGQVRAAAYFHETCASGPPWKSAFWHRRRQQRVLGRIVAQCELLIASIERNLTWLQRQAHGLPGVSIEQMSVFSAAGESEALIPVAERNPSMVVFGLAGTRQWAYEQMRPEANLVRSLGIEEILDVGPDGTHPSAIHGIPVKRMGLVPYEGLPALFSQARFGFVPHPWFVLGKSSVVAGYCAHGTIPVLAKRFPQRADGLQDGVQVVTPQTVVTVRDSGWDRCSRAAWNWYMQHSLRYHAQRYAEWMGSLR